ncbi:MAG: apolipoprotein N-acyltransferase [Alphaproteobacteria bacterium]|nr:apolipoprotein N-acyltransferase [Alphaproteobacteria bacterium]
MLSPGVRSFLAKIFGIFALGGVSCLSMAPWNIWPLLFLGLSGLYIYLHKASKPRTAALYGFVFGLGYFGFGLYWIGNALLVENNPYKWVWPLAVMGMPLMLSPFPALACYLFKKIFISDRLRGYLSFTALLLLSEWMRGHLFTGFPWNLYGYTWADILPIAQIISLSDIYLLTGLTIFWAGLGGFLVITSHKKSEKIIIASGAAILLLAIYAYGAYRLENNPTNYHKDTYALIVQPNIDIAHKWDKDFVSQNFFTQIKLSLNEDETKKSTDKTFIIWPETSIAPIYLPTNYTTEIIADTLKTYPGETILITGAMRYERENKTSHNSVVMIDKNAQTTNIYDKSHLVPFGEYIPLEDIIHLSPIVGFSGFVAGPGPKSMQTPDGLFYSPLICYESIFPDTVAEEKGPRPDFIVNVSNDSWFGNSPGPYQHFEQARFRAIEEGIPVLRSANSGISGVIDPLGRIIYKTKLLEKASNKIALPERLAKQNKKIYRVNIITFSMIFIMLILGLKKYSPFYKP